VLIRIHGEASQRPLAVAGSSKIIRYELLLPLRNNFKDGASVKHTALRSCTEQVAGRVHDYTCCGPFPIGDSRKTTKTPEHAIIPGVVDLEHGSLVLRAALV